MLDLYHLNQRRDRRDYARTFNGIGELNIQGKRSIFLEDCDLSSWEDEDEAFVEMWKEGKCVYELAEFFKRDPDEIIVWCIHLARTNKITQRSAPCLVCGGRKG